MWTVVQFLKAIKVIMDTLANTSEATNTVASMEEDQLKITITDPAGITTITFDPESHLAVCQSPVKIKEKTDPETKAAIKKLQRQYMELITKQEDKQVAEAMMNVRSECSIHVLKNKLAIETSKNQDLEEEIEENDEVYRAETTKLREQIQTDQIKLKETQEKYNKLQTIETTEKEELRAELIKTKETFEKIMDIRNKDLFDRMTFNAKDSLFLLSHIRGLMEGNRLGIKRFAVIPIRQNDEEPGFAPPEKILKL